MFTTGSGFQEPSPRLEKPPESATLPVLPKNLKHLSTAIPQEIFIASLTPTRLAELDEENRLRPS
jgi:hypothetical protein